MSLPVPLEVEGRSWKEWLLRVVLYFFSFALLLIMLPIFLPMSFILRIYREILKALIKKKKGDDAMFVTGDDAVWLQDSRENMLVINAMVTMKGRPDIAQLRKHLTENMVWAKDEDGELVFPKATRYTCYTMRRHVWQDEFKFNINEHVYLYDRDIPQTQNMLQEIVGEIISEPLPVERAPWQFVVIPPSDDDKRDIYYVVFRVHHSIADGVSLVRLLMNNVMDGPVKDNLMTKRFGAKHKFSRLLWALYKGPGLMLERIIWKGDNHILHGPKLTGRKLVAWSDSLDLDLVKRIKNATGTTVNDVLMSCLAGSFSEYFTRHSSSIPSNLLAYVPVDIRSPKSKLVLDNQFALVFYYLPMGLRDPLAFLKETKARMTRIKKSPEPIVSALMIKYCMARLPNWFTKVMFDNFAKKCTMVLSNVPGPEHKMTMVQQEIEDMMFWPPGRGNVGLGVSIFTYNNKVRMGVMVDNALLSNPNLLIAGFVPNVYTLAKELNLE